MTRHIHPQYEEIIWCEKRKYIEIINQQIPLTVYIYTYLVKESVEKYEAPHTQKNIWSTNQRKM